LPPYPARDGSPEQETKDFRYQCAACRINIATREIGSAPTSAHGIKLTLSKTCRDVRF